MKTFSNIVIAVMFVFYFFGIEDANKDVDTTVAVTVSETTTSESSILQDVAISDGNYYYNGKPVFLDEDCSTLLWQILDSNISCVVPVATYVEYVDNVAIMHLD